MRMTNTLATEIIKPALKERLPEMAAILRGIDASDPAVKMDEKRKISKQNAGKRIEARLNALAEVSSKLEDWFNALLEAITANLRLFNLKSKLDEIGSLTEKLSIREWKKMVHKTLGINIEGMSREEGREYIAAKLKGAGGSEDVFEPPAVEAIPGAAEGAARMVNKLCNASLIIGDSCKEPVIGLDTAIKAIDDCTLD